MAVKLKRLRVVTIKGTARVVKAPRPRAPRVSPRVTAREALRAVRRYPGGREALRLMGDPPQPVPIGFVSPLHTHQGTGAWLACWNCELLRFETSLAECAHADRLFSSSIALTFSNIQVGGANGVFQAMFGVPATPSGTTLFVVKLSATSLGTHVRILLDATDLGLFSIFGNGFLLPLLVAAPPGNHVLTVVHTKPPNISTFGLWFHSITQFRFSFA